MSSRWLSSPWYVVCLAIVPVVSSRWLSSRRMSSPWPVILLNTQILVKTKPALNKVYNKGASEPFGQSSRPSQSHESRIQMLLPLQWWCSGAHVCDSVTAWLIHIGYTCYNSETLWLNSYIRLAAILEPNSIPQTCSANGCHSLQLNSQESITINVTAVIYWHRLHK